MRISDWSSDVCSSDLVDHHGVAVMAERQAVDGALDRGERIIEGVHEQPAHGIDHQHAMAATALEHAGAAAGGAGGKVQRPEQRSEEHTSELQSLMRISYAVFCLKKKKQQSQHQQNDNHETSTRNPKD